MNLVQLKELIQYAQWFTRLGRFQHQDGYISINGLQDLFIPQIPSKTNGSTTLSDKNVTWLPSSRDETDPVHDRKLEDLIKQQVMQVERSGIIKDIYRRTLQSLRIMNQSEPLLQIGPHNFALVAKGAALYAMRQAAMEVVLGMDDFWCSVTPLYRDGHWPLGIIEGGIVVVF